jgi:hypothetical protein
VTATGGGARGGARRRAGGARDGPVKLSRAELADERPENRGWELFGGPGRVTGRVTPSPSHLQDGDAGPVRIALDLFISHYMIVIISTIELL